VNKLSRDLVQAMKEAAEFAEGKTIGVRVHVVEVPDVRAIGPLLPAAEQRFVKD
jgi:hypothetical protein